MDIGIENNIFDKGFSRWGDKKYLKLGSIGYIAIDFNMADTNTSFYSLPKGEAIALIEKEKKLIKEAGMTISQVHGPWRWPPQDGTLQDREERFEKMARSIELTSVLDCKFWVVHPIMPFGICEKGTDNEQETWNLNVSFMKRLLPVAKENNVTICLENMPMREFSLATPLDILRLVKEIDDDNFKICLDTGHVSVFENISLGDSVRALGEYIKVFHIHDNKFGMDLHLFPYFGIIDWEGFKQSLKDIKFDGVFSLETVPNPKLPDDLYEDMCLSLFKIADMIANK